MAKYNVGTNVVRLSSSKPREHDKHVMECCTPEMEHETFKWVVQTGVTWLSQLCNEAGTHLRTEPLSRMTSNTSVPHTAAGAQTARVLDCILSSLTQTDPSTQGGRLTDPLGPWHEPAHHRGYPGSFINFSGPGDDPRLIEVCSTREGTGGGSTLHGWEYTPTQPSAARRSDRRGTTGKEWGNPTPVTISIDTASQKHVRLAETARARPGASPRPNIKSMGGQPQMVLGDHGRRTRL